MTQNTQGPLDGADTIDGAVEVLEPGETGGIDAVDISNGARQEAADILENNDTTDSDTVEGYAMTVDGVDEFLRDGTILTDRGRGNLRNHIRSTEEVLQKAEESKKNLGEFNAKLSGVLNKLDKIVEETSSSRTGISGYIENKAKEMVDTVKDAPAHKRIIGGALTGGGAGTVLPVVGNLFGAGVGAYVAYKAPDILDRMQQREQIAHSFANGEAGAVADAYEATIDDTGTTLASLKENEDFMVGLQVKKQQELALIDAFLKNDTLMEEAGEAKKAALKERKLQINEELGRIGLQIESIQANIHIFETSHKQLVANGKTTIEEIVHTAIAIQTAETGREATKTLTTMRETRVKALLAFHKMTAASSRDLSQELDAPDVSDDVLKQILDLRRQTQENSRKLLANPGKGTKPSTLLIALQSEEGNKGNRTDTAA